MLRGTLLYLSRQGWIRHWVEQSRLTQGLTTRFVAGNTLDQALQVCRRIGQDGTLVTLDYLGESVTSLDEARMSRDVYLNVLDQLAAQRIPATVSLKLTQFGLDVSEAACCRNVRDLIERAHGYGTRVEIDMEPSEYTDRTLAIVEEMHQAFGCVRAVIQAYLRRSEQDIRRLNELRIPVRLCKGAYNEPATVALPHKPEVDANYEKLMRLLLDEGTYPAIASHDEPLVRKAVRHATSRGLAAGQFEFQMLYGIRRDLQQELRRNGFNVRLYVPFGNAWYPYFMRRLAERPANLLFLVKNLVRP